ncbi:uncharacterized protein BDCG_08836 [Blastomyces dermatitidis ER-3]|uniref:Uncharacterized protein n=1 Tax=Ajellomyces dermatitidis (strain ER-3 / ATCC MYA-2586) TaxID=559297 RepID=A0ABM9YGA5_AJEDR|nr:uncharacterized protein BDCG_08836 [Blastomyces dermatitidis ER-3]EEQ85567.2 hypothetical protein BDCG_08836 [Blastomyces dermatitidis ER-3]
MQPSNSKHVKKPWTAHSRLVQMRYQQKGTLQCMLRSYFDDCHCKGVYLLIHEDNQYFTINFNKSDSLSSHFPSPDEDIVSAMSDTAQKRHTLTETGEALSLSIPNNVRELHEISEVQRGEEGKTRKTRE